jgi:hypothetical protein
METTLNIHVDILAQINRAARARGISRSKTIIILIKNVMKDIPDPGRMGRLVQYQPRNSPDKWHRFHIQLRIDDYEYLLDLRKLLKMSVSSILAYALQKYGDKLMDGNGADNNRYKNYMIIREVIDNIICWRFIWGYPPRIEKFLPTISTS